MLYGPWAARRAELLAGPRTGGAKGVPKNGKRHPKAEQSGLPGLRSSEFPGGRHEAHQATNPAERGSPMGHLPVGTRVTLKVDECAQETKEQCVRTQAFGFWFLRGHRAYRRPGFGKEAIVRHNLQHRSSAMGGNRNGLSRPGRRRPNQQPYNNGLHQTGRGGAAVSLCRRPVVEARPAGEAECWADL